MSRQARQIIADIPYHVMNRGNNHQQIFFDDDDYQFFLHALKLAKEQHPCKIYSFVLMTNHIHLLLEPIKEDQLLALFIKQITQRYGQYVNKKYQRTGTLWEGRFKSSPISTDHYLLACSRYIEMNPVRAGIVEKPEDYEYSSYGAKTGISNIDWLDRDFLYESFGKTGEERQIGYRTWFSESISQDEWKNIRESLMRNWPYGNALFTKEIEAVSGRTFKAKKRGRKPIENK
ncbi:MAG: transposase [Deltaproteobacteria bacterium]|nr:transposase [Deltaproteobacteria bacterium]MBW2596192.1 transposase [Deltaproteobacteria bacterium]MBW2649740.1 transposase [Deltaproteobacteria bacterium]